MNMIYCKVPKINKYLFGFVLKKFEYTIVNIITINYLAIFHPKNKQSLDKSIRFLNVLITNEFL